MDCCDGDMRTRSISLEMARRQPCTNAVAHCSKEQRRIYHYNLEAYEDEPFNVYAPYDCKHFAERRH